MEKESTPERPSGQTYDLSGMFSLALRLVVGWTYFSAFWRRLVLFRGAIYVINMLQKKNPGNIVSLFH